MRMRSTVVNLETGHYLATQSVLGQHALYSVFDDALGMGIQHAPGRDPPQAALVTAVARVYLLVKLAAGELNLVGIDHDDEVTTRHVRCEIDLVLSAQQLGNLRGEAAHSLTLCVHEQPVVR